MRYDWYSSDVNYIGLENANVTYEDIQGFKVPCFDSTIWAKMPPYNSPIFGTWLGAPSPSSGIVMDSRFFTKIFAYNNTLFYVDFGNHNGTFEIPRRVSRYISISNPVLGFGISNLGLFYLDVGFDDGSRTLVTSFSDYDLDAFLVKSAEYFCSTENIKYIGIVRVLSFESVADGYVDVTWNLNFEGTYGPIVKPFCCTPDFAPIVKALGGFPVSDQFQNLKMICQLLGVDTNMTLDNCEAMKEYLKRIVQVLGGFSQNEPNDNLKIICDLLGVDSDPQGLSDCDLSKDYVKRISKMLGAE